MNSLPDKDAQELLRGLDLTPDPSHLTPPLPPAHPDFQIYSLDRLTRRAEQMRDAGDFSLGHHLVRLVQLGFTPPPGNL